MSLASTMPTISEIDSLNKYTEVADPDFLALEAEIKRDLQIAGDIVNQCIKLPEVSAKYAALIARLEHLEFLADERAKAIRSKIVIAFEDNPKAFLENCRHRNMQIVEAVYRSHPQYKAAIKDQLGIAAMRKMVAQTTYAIDQKRSMLESLMKARMAGITDFAVNNTPSPEYSTKNKEDKL